MIDNSALTYCTSSILPPVSRCTQRQMWLTSTKPILLCLHCGFIFNTNIIVSLHLSSHPRIGTHTCANRLVIIMLGWFPNASQVTLAITDWQCAGFFVRSWKLESALWEDVYAVYTQCVLSECLRCRQWSQGHLTATVWSDFFTVFFQRELRGASSIMQNRHVVKTKQSSNETVIPLKALLALCNTDTYMIHLCVTSSFAGCSFSKTSWVTVIKDYCDCGRKIYFWSISWDHVFF